MQRHSLSATSCVHHVYRPEAGIYRIQIQKQCLVIVVCRLCNSLSLLSRLTLCTICLRIMTARLSCQPAKFAHTSNVTIAVSNVCVHSIGG